MVDIKNTYQDFELENGEVVKLTLTFGRLNLLKSVNNELYNKFNNVLYGDKLNPRLKNVSFVKLCGAFILDKSGILCYTDLYVIIILY